jgi:copper transporter 1
MMMMYWNWSAKVPYVFFKWWTIESLNDMILSCLCVFLLAFFYESFGIIRVKLDLYFSKQNQKDKDNLCCKRETSFRRQWTFKQQLIRSLVHALQTFYALFVMMIFMTYNGYLNTALIIGAFFGYFIFQWFNPQPTHEVSCH